jgi:hypothetical protein
MTDTPFEFSPEQNKLFIFLARLMKYAALLFLFLAVIVGIFCGFTITKMPVRGSVYLLMTVMLVVFGVWTNIVSYSFKQIVETTGRDIDILMQALRMLKQVYILQFLWLLIITIFFIIVLAMNAYQG